MENTRVQGKSTTIINKRNKALTSEELKYILLVLILYFIFI